MSYYSSPNPNLIDYAKNYSGIKTLTVGLYDLRVVSTVTLLGLHNRFLNTTVRPKRKERVSLRFGCVVGLDKGLCNPNRIVFDTNSNSCATLKWGSN